MTKEELEELEKLSAPMISVIYNELKTLRDNSQLIPGQQYRITDYVTITTQENTRSAGHPFDVIVLALSENTLAEEAYAIQREFNIEDYKDAYSHTWSEKMIYLGTYEYKGKVYHHYESESQDMEMLVDFEKILFDADHSADYGNAEFPFCFRPSYAKSDEDWDTGEVFGESIAFKTYPNYFANSNLAAWQIWYSLDNDTSRFAWADAENGKGIIYRMIDEWNNDVPYDFKNIQFKRGVYDGGGIAPDGDEDMNFNLFTFSFRTENNEIIDTSIFGNNGRLLNDEGQIVGVYGNVIGQYMTYDGSIENPTKTTQRLNDIVFYSRYDYDDGFYYGCFSNTFGNGCYGNSFNNHCYNNSFDNDCASNSFGNICYSNSFGNDCRYNSFGENCYENSFDSYCYDNSFGNECYYNSFGNNCHGNSFGNNCWNNTFENGYCSNSLGDDCSDNSFGNYCYNNTFHDNCYSNSFGESCNSNKFGNECRYNSFGNGCCNNSFRSSASKTAYLKNYCYYNHFDDGCSYNVIWNIDTTAIYRRLQNINVNKGVSGTVDSYNMINITTLNQDYEIQVAKNSKGEIKIYCEADLIA